VKPQIWEWRWWCACGYDASSAAYTEQDAKILVSRSATAHAQARPEITHTWQTEWNRVS
jgi:hypothetical protein